MLPYGQQFVDDDDIKAVTEALKSDFLTTGPRVDAFEKALAARLQVHHVVVCNSGTSALHMAAMASGLGPGDKAIVPSMTFVATANAVRMTGAEVILADVDPSTGLMEVEHFKQAVEGAGGAVKAVFPVHLTGQCADMKAIRKAADQLGVMVVTDACHALGGYHLDGDEQTAPLGSCVFEDMACFSFHPVKAIAMGEGGAVVTNNPDVAEKLRLLRSHGITRAEDDFQNTKAAFSPSGEVNPWYYECQSLGYNFRIPDILCALGLSQLKKLDTFVTRRRELANLYDEAFASFGDIIQPNRNTGHSLSGHHLYSVRIDFERSEKNRADVMRLLSEQGIGSQVHYIPVHLHPFYAANVAPENMAGVEEYYRQTLSLPLHMNVTNDDVQRVVKVLHGII
ncbi:MAG: UDP-4-amino-4,6-dideoxy-N-acetyl-beta-L-altrosamine transaminase [Sphingomonadales bacterium]|nr:UDP-4-amino-4,6-dideoxy-N-acetyl-beta-L-altrosamine transaminase [Sphingomonadales bacterium]